MDDKIFTFPICLLEVGFSIQETSGCVTALTIFIALLTDYESDQKTELMNTVVMKYIENGVNLESSALFLPNSIRYYKIVKTEWLVPDVLLVSFLNGIEELVHKFLANWWAPPLALLYFHSVQGVNYCCEWYFGVKRYGNIPHGTVMFKIMDKVVKNVYRDVQTGKHQQRTNGTRGTKKFTLDWPKYLERTGKYFYVANISSPVVVVQKMGFFFQQD
jgi:hypothetical protein